MQQERSFSLKESIPFRHVLCHATSSHILPSSHPIHLILSHPMSFPCVHHSIRAMVTKHWLFSSIFRIVIPCLPNSSFSDAGICTPRKDHVPSHIVPLFLLIYPPLDWRSDGQSTMKMNSPRSHGFYIAILIVRYITIKSLSGRILDILNILEFPWDYTTP